MPSVRTYMHTIKLIIYFYEKDSRIETFVQKSKKGRKKGRIGHAAKALVKE